jgi:hypothetical protein
VLGKYAESVSNFTEIINKVTEQAQSLNDKNLIAEWNKLIQVLKIEKERASSMI